MIVPHGHGDKDVCGRNLQFSLSPAKHIFCSRLFYPKFPAAGAISNFPVCESAIFCFIISCFLREFWHKVYNRPVTPSCHTAQAANLNHCFIPFHKVQQYFPMPDTSYILYPFCMNPSSHLQNKVTY